MALGRHYWRRITTLKNITLEISLGTVILVGTTILLFYSIVLITILRTPSTCKEDDAIITEEHDIPNIYHEELKYILQWSSADHPPLNYLGIGVSAFVNNNCSYINCFVTDDKNYFLDQTDFDAIIFYGHQATYMTKTEIPKQRSVNQIYIFASMESPGKNQCNLVLNNFFNWTWTYRLDSDIQWTHITVYNLTGSIIRPSKDMKWPKNIETVNEEIKTKLQNKNKAVAWVVFDCVTESKREQFAQKLKAELMNYGLALDTYGSCGKYRYEKDTFNKMVERNYYFYLASESSFAEDFVSNTLLKAINNFAVPVVYGGANYSRFLPPGSYLDARKLGVTKLAKKINEIILNKKMYENFFRWRNYFYYRDTSDNIDICNLCEAMNDNNRTNRTKIYKNFGKWWHGVSYNKTC